MGGPGARAGRVHAALAVVGCAALGGALLWPAGFGGEVLSACAPFVRLGPFPAPLRAAAPQGTPVLSDPMQTFEPWLAYAADAFERTGSLPLWKDTNLCGAPLLGNAQSALLWPPNLAAVLLGAPLAALAWTALLELVLAGLGTFALARHVGLSVAGALLAGLVFAFGGFQVVYLLFPLSNVSVLLPWLVLCADRAALRPDRRRVAALAAVAALQHLGGHPETAFHAQAFAGLLVLLRAAGLAGGVAAALRSRALLLPAAGLALGLAAAAVAVLPFVEYLRLSEVLALRAHEASAPARLLPSAASLLVPLALVAAWTAARRLARATARPWPAAAGLGAACLLLFVAGRGDGLDLDPVLHLAPDWFGAHDAYRAPENYVLANGGYAGAALALVVLGMLAGAPRALARTAGLVFVVALLLAHGTPVLTGLLELLPPFDVSVNARLQLLALLAAAILAGMGLDALGARTATGDADGPPAAARRPGTASAPAGGLRLRWALLLVAPLLAGVAALPVHVARGLHQDTPTLRAVRAAQRVPAEALGAEDIGPGRRAVAGWIAPGAPVEHALVLFGRARTVPATLVPVPDARRAEDPALAAIDGPAYAYHAELDGARLPPGAPWRVLCAGPDGATYLSAPLQAPREGADPPASAWRDGGAWRAWIAAARPEGPGSAGQLGWLLAAALLVAAGLHARAAVRGLLRGLLVAVCAGSLLAFGHGFLPSVPASLVYPPAPFLDALAGLRPDGRFVVAHGTTFLLRPETGAAYGLAEASGYDAMAPARVVSVLRAAADDPRAVHALAHLPARPDPDRRLLGVMGVAAFAHSADLPVAGATLHRDEPGYVLTANERYLPRARVVPRAVVEPDDARALARLRDPRFDPSTTVVLAAEPGASATPATQPPSTDAGGVPGATGAPDTSAGLVAPSAASIAPAASARISIEEPDRVVVELSGDAAGHLVLADTFFPGWTARVDGEARDIARANVAFRAVAVREGDRRVVFEYRPGSFRLGAAVSAISALVLLALALARRRPDVRTGRGSGSGQESGQGSGSSPPSPRTGS